MRKVNWGVLGTAGIAEGCTIPGMNMAENCCRYAIAGRNPEKVQEFQNKFGFEKTYNSYDELLDDPKVEAVYIPLPNHLHYEWTLKALKKKKHVLCEKPLAPTVEEMQEMIDTAKENHVILMEAFAYLHSPLIKAVKKELEQKSIGDILYIESAFITSDYNPLNIRMRSETAGGCLYDLGCYNTSLIQWMLGEEPEQVKAVTMYSDQEVDIYTSAIMEYKNSKRASFDCGMCLLTDADKRIDRWQIHGTKGYIKTEAEFNGEGDLDYVICKDGKAVTKTVHVPHNYMLEVEQMGRCIADGEKPYISNEFSLANGRTIARISDEIRK